MIEHNPAVSILGVKVYSLSVAELHEQIRNGIQDQIKRLILHVNVHGLNLAWEMAWLREYFNAADLVFCDGAGVRLGARILGYRLKQRITYADWIWQLSRFCADQHYRLFFLGGQPGVAAKAAACLQAENPHLEIPGTHHGYFDKRPGSVENQRILQHINTIKPDILLVGFGMPLQELWLKENWQKLDATIGLTGGAVFDYVSGALTRAPSLLTEHNLEWLGRLLIEPRRLWRRYLVGNPLFLARVIKQRLREMQA